MGEVYLPPQLECPMQPLYVMVNRVKGSGRAPPTLTSNGADFSIMMECTQEIGNCHSVCVLCGPGEWEASVCNCMHADKPGCGSR